MVGGGRILLPETVSAGRVQLHGFGFDGVEQSVDLGQVRVEFDALGFRGLPVHSAAHHALPGTDRRHVCRPLRRDGQ